MLCGGEILHVFEHADPRHALPERGVDEYALLGDALGDVGAVGVRAVGVFVDAVDDGVDSGVEGVGHALRGGAVRGGVLAEAVGFVADCAKFFNVEGRPERVAGAGAAAGGGNLDEVRALLDELADGCAALVHACCGGAEVAEVAAYDGDGPAGEHEARSGDDAQVNRLTKHECGAVLCAAVSQRGNAGVEVAAGVLRCLHGEHLVGQGYKLVARSSVADAVQMDMGVHEAGQDGSVAVVDFLH